MIIADGRVGLNDKAVATVRVWCLPIVLFPFKMDVGQKHRARSENWNSF